MGFVGCGGASPARCAVSGAGEGDGTAEHGTGGGNADGCAVCSEQDVLWREEGGDGLTVVRWIGGGWDSVGWVAGRVLCAVRGEVGGEEVGEGLGRVGVQGVQIGKSLGRTGLGVRRVLWSGLFRSRGERFGGVEVRLNGTGCLGCWRGCGLVLVGGVGEVASCGEVGDEGAGEFGEAPGEVLFDVGVVVGSGGHLTLPSAV
jgi:hypothetical protein